MRYYCPVSGLKVRSNPDWLDQPVSETFRANFWIIDESIIYSLPKGFADMEGVQNSLAINAQVIDIVSNQVASYIQIEDYACITGSDTQARRQFTNTINSVGKDQILIFCNLSTPLAIAVKIGKRFNTSGKFVHVARDYPDAIKLAISLGVNQPSTDRLPIDLSTYRGDEGKTLAPVDVIHNPAWDIQTPEYTNKMALIDQCILHSTTAGHLDMRHLPQIDRVRLNYQGAIADGAAIHYMLVDCQGLESVSRKVRLKYVESLNHWHQHFPLQMYVLYGATPFMKTALHLHKSAMPFRVEIARDLDQAFQLVREDQTGHPPAAQPDLKNETTVMLSHADIDQLLAFAGAINWDLEGVEEHFDLDDDHPFYFLYQSFKLIKEEFDDIFKERKLFENELVKSRKMEAIGNLAGGIAHDFNNMLGVILGHSELALMHIDASHPAHVDLKLINEAAQRSADLTRQLLAFARKQPAIPKVLNLNDTIAGMLKMLQRLIGENIDLVWKPGADLWPVKIDPSQVDQIMTNLCINARDAFTEAGEITIQTKNVFLDEKLSSPTQGLAAGHWVMLEVRDGGCGMDETTLENLFEPFFTTKEAGKGTGLGLATVYGLVKQNDGKIQVHSETGSGTAFEIFLPRTHESDDREQKPAEGHLARGAETILVVEDETFILDMSKSMLERLGYRVLTARTPSEALEKADSNPNAIDLLITDVVMPEMNGKDLAEQIQKMEPDITALYMSGYTSDIISHKGIVEKDVHFLPKPFTIESLSKKVRGVLDHAGPPGEPVFYRNDG